MAAYSPPYQAYYQKPGQCIAMAVAIAILACLMTTLRFFTRIKYHQGLKADDYLILPATIGTVGLAIAFIYGVTQKAFAYPTESPDGPGNSLVISTSAIALMSKIEYTFIIVFPVAVGCTKLSFLFFYKRIFAVSRWGTVNILLGIMIAICALWGITFPFVAAFECGTHFSALWGAPQDLQKYCLNGFKLSLGTVLSDFLLDIILIIFPLPLIMRLKMEPRYRFATAGVFLLGAVVVVASTIRVVQTTDVYLHGYDPHADEILTITKYVYWQLVECGVGVLAACLPTVKWLARFLAFDMAWNSIISAFSNRSGHNSNGSGSSGGHSSRFGRNNQTVQPEIQGHGSTTRLESRKSSMANSQGSSSGQNYEMDDMGAGRVRETA